MLPHVSGIVLMFLGGGEECPFLRHDVRYLSGMSSFSALRTASGRASAPT